MPNKLERILVAIDYSPASKAAVSYGVSLAEKFGAALDLLHVTHPAHVRGDDDVAVLHRGVPGSTLEAYNEEEVQDQLTEFVKSAGLDRQVRNDEIEQHRDPAQCILQMAADKSYDLIILGKHGRKGALERLFVGSVAQKVVEAAKCPVLTCHAPPAS